MKAIVLTDFGDVNNLQMQELPIPEIKDDEVLVQVKAISINPVDVKTRRGKAAAGKLEKERPMILGWDISGVIDEVGKAVTNFKKGDEVFGMINFPGHGKAYAEYVAASCAHLAIKPNNISHEEAAAATLAALTAWEAIVDALKIGKNDKFLVHAAAGGVGHFAVQIAKHSGAYVIGTASAANKDFVLDTIGGDNIDLSLKLMKPGGSILSLVSGKNEEVQEKAAAKGMKGMRLLVHSSGENQQKIATLMEKGIIKPHVSKIYSFDQMPEAHLQIESGRTVGKVIVKL